MNASLDTEAHVLHQRSVVSTTVQSCSQQAAMRFDLPVKDSGQCWRRGSLASERGVKEREDGQRRAWHCYVAAAAGRGCGGLLKALLRQGAAPMRSHCFGGARLAMKARCGGNRCSRNGAWRQWRQWALRVNRMRKRYPRRSCASCASQNQARPPTIMWDQRNAVMHVLCE